MNSERLKTARPCAVLQAPLIKQLQVCYNTLNEEAID